MSRIRLSKLEEIEAVLRIHGEAVRLIRLQSVLDYRFGEVCRALKPELDHLGYSSFATFVVESLGVAPRTATRSIELVEVLERFGQLRQAYLDGVLHQQKVLALAPVLRKSPDQEEVLIELASRLTVRALHEALGSKPEPEHEGRVGRTYFLKPTDWGQVMDALELARRMGGAELSQSEAIELLTGDMLSGLKAPEVELPEPTKRRRSSRVEEAMEECFRQWDFLGARLQPLELLERSLPREPLALQQEARDLLQAGRSWQSALGQLLVTFKNLNAPCFATVGHFASECLGMSASQARALELRERRLATRPRLREALLVGRISPSQLDILWPAFERGLETEPWVRFCAFASCKVLRLWVSFLMRLEGRSFEKWASVCPDRATPPTVELLEPISLTELDPYGLMLGPAQGLGALMTLFLEWSSCQTLAMRFLGQEVMRFQVLLHPDGMVNLLSLEAAISQHAGEELAREQCLVVAAKAFVLSNQDEHLLVGQQKRLLFRDRFMCCAPGCTRRHNLHAHHIVFRSQQGGNADENLIMLCSACHLRLVHKGYLKVSGTADNLVFERAGERVVNGLRVLASNEVRPPP